MTHNPAQKIMAKGLRAFLLDLQTKSFFPNFFYLHKNQIFSKKNHNFPAFFLIKLCVSGTSKKNCIFSPEFTLEDRLKLVLLQETGFVTASTLQRQMGSNLQSSLSFLPFEIKQELAFSIQKKNNVQTRMSRAQKIRKSYNYLPSTNNKPC